jgi:membrane protease subunit HflC
MNIIWVPIGLVIFALFVGGQAAFTIDEKEQVIVTQMGEYVKTVDKPGLNFKVPFIQTVHRMETRVLVSDAPPAEYLTMDKMKLVVDSYTRWRIADPFLFYKTVRNEAGARLRLDGIVASQLRTEFAANNLWDIIGPEREPIMASVARDANKVVREFGMEVLDVRIKRADLPVEVQASVFDRMMAERMKISMMYRAEGEEEARMIRAEADREATVILAEAYKKSKKLRGAGDANATVIYAAAFGQDPEFYSFVRTLEAYEKFLADGTTLVLSSDSELFKYLESPKVRK